MESKNLEVCKDDLKKIGTAFGNDDGMTVFACNLSLQFIEEILLRNILDLYGYKIVSFGEIPCGCDDCEDVAGIGFGTTMPWEEYTAL